MFKLLARLQPALFAATESPARPGQRACHLAGRIWLVRDFPALRRWLQKANCKIRNREGVPSPAPRNSNYNAGIWNASTLSGALDLGDGILNILIYMGRRIFNRRRCVEIPNENRRFPCRPHLKPESDWELRYEPRRGIIDQELWNWVQARQAEARFA